MKKGEFPPGWDLDRVNRIILNYEPLRKQALLSEGRFEFDGLTNNTIRVPKELVPIVQDLIRKYETA
ncbi:MAG: hypothetical protein ACU826_05750 [Gammaproteobacteria bacterium]